MGIFFEILFDFRKIIVEAILLLGLWFLLSRETKKLEKIVVNLGEKISELQEDVSSVQENAADETHEQNWSTVKDLWSSTRAKIQKEIKSISHKSSREKYKKFKKYTYEDIINQLRTDRKIKLDIQIKLLEMDNLFRIFRRRPQKIDNVDLQNFKNLYSEITSNKWS